jgi:D-beta-D-heptose 7-phosphate kinase/D-beta-D-heptose 1-phosphate adenosyltransferase
MKVWINGTFDVLHRGHIELFRYAYGFGDVRVGIDTDERVKKLKGNDRPVNKFEDRKTFLESIKFIDSVVGFSSDEELEEQIKSYQPNYMVIGSDYKDKKVIGSEFVKNLIFFDRIENFSTTNIINGKTLQSKKN